MRIKRLRYASYRNLENVEFNPASGFNVFFGQNGQGKTNLLEGIYLLGHLKSFRAAHTETMIHCQQTKAVIESELTNGNVHHHVHLTLQREGKEIRLDGKRPQRISDVAEHIRQVLFSPEEVATVKGSPGLRRNLLDRAIFQIQPNYLEKMQNYFRLLKHRNQLLREQRSLQEIDVWSQGLREEAAVIRSTRLEFAAQLKPFFSQCYERLTAEREKPAIYLRGEENPSVESQREYLDAEFSRLQEQEKLRRTTLIGPHRDDPKFQINEQDLKVYGSQGQQRTFVLAFKLALLQLLKEKTGKTAVLMLDDITSELDANRREALFSLIKETAGQVFITTTDPDLIMTQRDDDCLFCEVKNGQIDASSTLTR